MKNFVLSKARRLVLDGLNLAHFSTGKIRSMFPSIKAIYDGDHVASTSKKHAVFVHFDPVGQVHDFVFKHLDALRECGFEITFVSNSPKLPESSLALLRPYTRLIVHRYNSGYDFAAYRDGISQLPDLDNAEALIVMNDSVYGPLSSLKDTLDKVDPAKVDVWGVTDSWEMRYHLQGYFMLFFQNAIRSKEFKKFWQWLPNVSSKRWVIENVETKITQILARAKLRIGVQCPYREVSRTVLDRVTDVVNDPGFEKTAPAVQKYLVDLQQNVAGGIEMNQSHQFWETGIRDWKCLYIKRELIQKNPLGVPLAWKWKEVVEEASDYDTGLIDSHLHSL